MSVLFTPSSPTILSDILFTDSIVSTISPFSPLNSIFTPVPLTINWEFNRPIIGMYETIDTNPDVRSKMLRYYFDLIRDDWLLDDLNDILNYFNYKDGKVNMINKLEEYNPNNIAKDTDQIAEKKVEFIEKNVFTKHDLKHVLRKFTKESNSKWVDLPKNEFFLKKVVKEYIIKEIKNKLRKH